MLFIPSTPAPSKSSVLGSTKDNKVENDCFKDYSRFNSNSCVEFKNQNHNCHIELIMNNDCQCCQH